MCTERPISREHQYTAFINVRNTEISVYWTRYNIQAFLNLGLLVAALSAKPDSLIGQHTYKMGTHTYKMGTLVLKQLDNLAETI